MDNIIAYAAAGRTQLLLNRLRDWLLYEGHKIDDTSELIAGFCRRLTNGGLPLSRVSFAFQTLHPLNRVYLLIWNPGQEKINAIHAPHGVESTIVFQQSPFRVLFEGGPALRRRLTGEDPMDFSVLEDFRKAGGTDYIALPMPFSNGETNAFTALTAAKGGFTDEELNLLRDATRLLTPFLEIRQVRSLAEVIADTYIGPKSGRRVLSGAISRGSSERFPAVIWFCDLRGFTALSEELEADALLQTLNSYFGVMCEAVNKEGGEVLKFMGDALLAIFPIVDTCCEKEACMRALKAWSRAKSAMALLNEKRQKENKPFLSYGIGLHVGEVLYGNIGGTDRLDFTVIGPAVNMASRLENLCAPLGKKLLISERFAGNIGGLLHSMGRHQLKGIAEPQEIFTCPTEVH